MTVRRHLRFTLHVLQLLFVFAEKISDKNSSRDGTTLYDSTTIESWRTSVETTEIPGEETFDLPVDWFSEIFENDASGSSFSSTDSTVSEFTDQSEILTSTDFSTSLETDSPNDTEEEIFTVELSVVDEADKWVLLAWNASSEDLEISRVLYTVETRENGEDLLYSRANITGTRYNVTDLQPCTSYSFTLKPFIDGREYENVVVRATTENFREPSVSQRLVLEKVDFPQSLTLDLPDIFYAHRNGYDSVILTGHAVGEVKNLRADAKGNHITLHWSNPLTDSTKCSYNYSISQCQLPQMHCNGVVYTRNHSYEAKDLQHCTQYVFTVKVIGSVESSGVKAKAKTHSPKLGAPRSAKADSWEFALFIHWKPPKNAACIKHYRITVGSPPITTTTSDTSIAMRNLKACTTYKIYINAVNEENSDGEMANIVGKTAASVMGPPVYEQQRLWATVNSIMIEWTILVDRKNNCSLESLITTCKHVGTDGHGYELLNSQSTDIIYATPPLTINTTVPYLSPYTNYNCFGIVVNVGGNSSASVISRIATLEDVPSAVTTFNVTDITETRFTLNWAEPEYLAGKLKEYEILLEWQPLFPIPDWCPRNTVFNESIANINGTQLNYEYLDTKHYSNYSARIRTRTTVGWGNYSDPLVFESATGVPGPTTNLSYIIKQNDNNPNLLNTILMWCLPCASNGMIESFNISVMGSRSGYPDHILSTLKPITNKINNNDVYSIDLEELKGEYNYTFKVSAKITGAENFGSEAHYTNIHYPAGIPAHPDEDYVKSITIDPYKARRSSSSAAILLPLFPDVNGEIRYYAIMVSKMAHNVATSTRFNMLDERNLWPNVSSWEESMLRDFSITYQATIPRWNPYPNYVIDYGHMKAVKYILGEDSTCKEISLNTDKRLYCNGPLKADTWYHVRMRAFTYGGYTDSTTFLIKTNAELNVAMVIGIIFGILFLGILTTMMLLVRRCSPQAVFRRFLHADMAGSPVPAPFTRKKFMSHCQQLVDNPGKLSNEFRLLQTLSVDLQMPTNTACLQANRKKNRYSDILPYDFSRVKLEAIDNDPNTDYINASFIRGYSGEDEYIACQGPKEETTYDFWRMVDQYDIKVIIMLTQLVEKGKEKCHQYFPTIRETFSFENMTIRCTSELDFRTYTQRTLVLQKESKKRSIVHLHFKDWPDHDVPEDFDPMIHFCQITRRNITANKGFAVIHCRIVKYKTFYSAGIGRTGTLIAIDILLQHLRDNRKLDVFGTVYRLRHHRINMVQRESQYAYIYNCLRQVLKNPYFLKTYKSPPIDAIRASGRKKSKDNGNSNVNLVDHLESSRKCHFSSSMDSTDTTNNLFSLSTINKQQQAENSGMKHSYSTGVLDISVQQPLLAKHSEYKRISLT